MILSSASLASLGPAPLVLAGVSMLAYLVAAGPWRGPSRWPALALLVGWLVHAVLLAMDISGQGHDEPGARLGFGPVLSLTVWLVLAVYTVESRLLPLPTVRRVLALTGAVAVILAWSFPGEVRPPASPWAPLHWVLGVASYGLMGAAVLHATMLDSAERQMRQRAGTTPAPLGMPLLRLERLTFRFVEIGFIVLTTALLMGMATTGEWRWTHKAVFSLLGWAVVGALLAGRQWRGWRGRRATRWLYVGAALLLLGYAGSRFVFEVLLGRPAP